MKHLLIGLALAAFLMIPVPAPAWDGFDAATTDLVEITPDQLPARGDTVTVRSYTDDSTESCLVERVTRNARTVEVVVRAPGGTIRTLVMEGR